MPDRTLTFRGERCHGGKKRKWKKKKGKFSYPWISVLLTHKIFQLSTTRKLCFFPANYTSKIQLLDLSVIRCVKVHYRKTLIRRLLAASETKREAKDELKQVTVLGVIHMLSSSWRNIIEKCIKSCFKKAGFSFPAENEYEEPENESENCENDINEEDWHTVSDGLATCTFNEFVDGDENLITAQFAGN
ncbi:hypothetical protein AVEN_250304-1 [Araneus ventricosus]|uniref:DDE-1 domain-containing protein n=1 Tax=Araneus ventricosus TaxID=182803 RepID=A0A4Y2FKV2_ARAVE|nr:hypothetical protein AVEN_250304-1 [Araneus ventricosus]